MNLTSTTQIKDLLYSHGLRPKKRLGQNFLIDRNVLNRIADASEASEGLNMLEVGPGLGVVTQELLSRGANVVCIEADTDLAPVLAETLQDYPQAQILIEDFLRTDLPMLFSSRGQEKWSVVGNLPYYITSPIISKLIENRQWVSSAVIMMQREVAARIQACPRCSEYGSMSVYVQYYCEVEDVAKVSRNVFFPIPDVDSELVKLIMRPHPAVDVNDEALFFAIVKASFAKRRKTLLNALSSSIELAWDKDKAGAALEAAGIDFMRRGETLDLQDFAQLADASEKCG